MKQDPMELLRSSWKVEPRADPGFRPAVWRRIDRARSSERSLTGWLRAHLRGVIAATAGAVAAASVIGLALARLPEGAGNGKLEAYLTSIDPHRQIAAHGNGGR